ncbi:MAG: sugar ABC transporter ATP-binding protein [Spirochaetota bacterium]
MNTLSTPLLEIQRIVKKFPGVVALDRVDFTVYSGEVHCLAGENGAGKSTLIEIIGGSHKQDEGNIFVNGREVKFTSPKHAQEMGIAVLHQESPILPYLSVAENIFLNRHPKTKPGFVSYAEMFRQAGRWLEMIHADINPKTLLGTLPLSKKQLVGIAKALSLEARLIIFDEPSAVLTNIELKRLFEIIDSLRSEGRGIIYISHRLEEIFEIGDRVTVLRNGKVVGTEWIRNITKEMLIKMLVGRDIVEIEERKSTYSKDDQNIALELRGFTVRGSFYDINLKTYKGEILGIYGLVGAGRTELARAITGADPLDKGDIYLEKKPLKINSPKDAIQSGICLVPEDRKGQGVLLEKSVQENIALPSLKNFKKFCFLNLQRITNHALDFVSKLRIVTPNLHQYVKFLSGGNQQKVVLAKWLGMNLKVFIFDEPTRGIDIGAKEEIKNIIIKLAEEGKSIIVISSEIPEILSLSNRIAVMHKGSIVKIMDRKDATKEKLIAYSMGAKDI